MIGRYDLLDGILLLSMALGTGAVFVLLPIRRAGGRPSGAGGLRVRLGRAVVAVPSAFVAGLVPGFAFGYPVSLVTWGIGGMSCVIVAAAAGVVAAAFAVADRSGRHAGGGLRSGVLLGLLVGGVWVAFAFGRPRLAHLRDPYAPIMAVFWAILAVTGLVAGGAAERVGRAVAGTRLPEVDPGAPAAGGGL